MQFYTDENRNKQNAFKGADPKTVHIPYNAGRRVGKRVNKAQGSFLTKTPADQIEVGGWVQNRLNDGEVVLGATTTVTAAATVSLTGAHTVYLANTTGGAYSLTLPPAEDNAGRFLTVKKITNDINAVTLDGNASETIDGATTNNTIDAQYDVMTLYCDGTGWHIISSIIA